MNTSTANLYARILVGLAPSDEQLIAAATERYVSPIGTDGGIEIDSDPDPKNSVSRDTTGQGAYVKAWVWVDFSDVEDFSLELFTSNLSSK